VSDIDINQLPSALKKFIQRNPKIWQSHEALGLACKKAGPLPEKQIEFIKIAIASTQTLETAFKTHNGKAAQAGASSNEMEQVVIQPLPIVGLGRTIMVTK
jgi:alkylhydroperoxidase/carboxymuconolactone decarboxylase family protein YurZ